jgi:hypothetical protein
VSRSFFVSFSSLVRGLVSSRSPLCSFFILSFHFHIRFAACILHNLFHVCKCWPSPVFFLSLLFLGFLHVVISVQSVHSSLNQIYHKVIFSSVLLNASSFVTSSTQQIRCYALVYWSLMKLALPKQVLKKTSSQHSSSILLDSAHTQTTAGRPYGITSWWNTNYLEQSYPWGPESSYSGHEIPCFLWNTKMHYLGHILCYWTLAVASWFQSLITYNIWFRSILTIYSYIRFTQAYD